MRTVTSKWFTGSTTKIVCLFIYAELRIQIVSLHANWQGATTLYYDHLKQVTQVSKL